MSNDRSAALRRLVLLLDVLILPVSATVAFWVHGAVRPHLPFLKDAPRVAEYVALLYLSVPLWAGLSVLLGVHRLFEQRWTRFGLLVDLVKQHAVGFLGLASLLYVLQGVLNRSIVFAFLAVNLVLTLVVRLAIGAWVQSRYARGETRESWLLVGAVTEQLAEFVRQAGTLPFAPRLCGRLGADAAGEGLPPRLGSEEDLAKVLHAGQVDMVVFFPPLNHPAEVRPLVHACESLGIRAAFAVDPVEGLPVAPRVLQIAQLPFTTFDWIPERSGAIALKHTLDFILSALALLVLSPLMLGAALAILVSMGRPIFFTQMRVGLNGRRFKLIKFRTMEVGAESKREALSAQNEMTGPVFKMTHDPRVTRLGRLLRQTSVDELPQLLNVLMGSMSLVGPRPLPVDEQQAIEGWYRRRLSMRPGITCTWQVSGRSNVSFNQWMAMDLAYIENWSLRLDLRILLQTVPAVLARRGAK